MEEIKHEIIVDVNWRLRVYIWFIVKFYRYINKDFAIKLSSKLIDDMRSNIDKYLTVKTGEIYER